MNKTAMWIIGLLLTACGGLAGFGISQLTSTIRLSDKVNFNTGIIENLKVSDESQRQLIHEAELRWHESFQDQQRQWQQQFADEKKRTDERIFTLAGLQTENLKLSTAVIDQNKELIALLTRHQKP